LERCGYLLVFDELAIAREEGSFGVERTLEGN
jgi:hypothetical protein